ncbi:MAG: sigma-54-dependent Fis family transcriptional regulator [Deltaproteobacteria bacterium]|nr:MAG: sigma-54-dependent Fis family transcriptional regulator [Deltaproteobacteria bacterium]
MKEREGPATRVLAIVADPACRRQVMQVLEADGYRGVAVADGELGLEIVRELQPALVLLTLDLPGLAGVQLVEQLLARVPSARILVLLEGERRLEAFAMVRAGASGWVHLPLERRALAHTLSEAQLPAPHRAAPRRAPDPLPDLLGEAPCMLRLKETIRRAAPARASVLVTGESGTGKELVALGLHRLSPRRSGPFVAVNCAALPESLLESELFGHERGAFTGAHALKRGRFERADGGTLFLDEIGEIPPSTQVKLLRVLQERCFERVGGTQTLSVDVRIVAATNKDLGELVEKGLYREDLFYRLNVISLEVPPLRRRRRDIPLLWSHLVARAARLEGRPTPATDLEVIAILLAAPWKGNVRELSNVAEHALVMCHGDRIRRADLPAYLRDEQPQADPLALEVPGMTLKEIERAAILRVYEATRHNARQTAKMLGISLRKVRYRLKAYREAGILPER